MSDKPNNRQISAMELLEQFDAAKKNLSQHAAAQQEQLKSINQHFSTGSQRDSAKGKGQPSRISTLFLDRLSKHIEKGLRKYGDRNWEKGQPLSRYIDSAQRHLWKIQENNTDEDHEAAWAWNCMAFMHTKELIKRGDLPQELDDLHEYSGYKCSP